ncbi:MAG: DUF1770 domain-containing protein, partial [Terriglobus roseus]|nr:DUF1770 domain-containing protein [Terriglobus roseus]
LQAASIQRNPDPRHDLNPSTAASAKVPIALSPDHEPTTSSSTPHHSSFDSISAPYDDSLDSPTSEDEIPLSHLRPLPRAQGLPPLPDLRFEQSYLRSVAGCASPWGVAWVTLRDQVLLAFLQGFGWTLVLGGWRHANRAGKFGGRGVGARLRRWWWGVNGWTLPERREMGEKMGEFYRS